MDAGQEGARGAFRGAMDWGERRADVSTDGSITIMTLPPDFRLVDPWRALDPEIFSRTFLGLEHPLPNTTLPPCLWQRACTVSAITMFGSRPIWSVISKKILLFVDSFSKKARGWRATGACLAEGRMGGGGCRTGQWREEEEEKCHTM